MNVSGKFQNLSVVPDSVANIHSPVGFSGIWSSSAVCWPKLLQAHPLSDQRIVVGLTKHFQFVPATRLRVRLRLVFDQYLIFPG